MVASNVFIYFTILLYFNSIQGIKDLPDNVTASAELVSVIDQIVTENVSTSRDFSPIFNYFVNLTVLAMQRREEVRQLTTANFTDGDENRNLDESITWQKAIDDALNEENITAEFNETLQEDVVEYIKSFISKPDGLKEKCIQNIKYEDTEMFVNESTAAEEFGHGTYRSTAENEIWDVDTRRIFRGNRTKIKFFPFMASVQIFNQFTCAGAIISSDLVITAASCLQLAWNNRFFRENPAFLSVRVGSHFFSVGGEVVPVLEVYFHPSYVPRTLYNNLALMRLQRRLRLRHRNVKKINIDRRASALPENTPGITIIGWGAKTLSNKITSAMVNKIHMAVLPFYDLQSCREIYGKKFVTRTNFCAGFITKGTGACNLDVGDPGISDGLLVGVTSFGSPVCGRVDTPTVFTKVGYYADWIEQLMEQKVPHVKMRTTTRRPFKIHTPVKLYGGEESDTFTYPLREALAPQDDDTGVLLNEPLSDDYGIQPITEAVPPEGLESKTMLRYPPQSNRDSNEDKNTVENVQEDSKWDKNWSNNDDDDDDDTPTMRPVKRMTRLMSYGPRDSVSEETDKDSLSREDDNMENIVRTSRPSAMDYDKSDASQQDIFNEKPETGLSDVDSEESMSSEKRATEGIFVEPADALGNDYEIRATTESEIHEENNLYNEDVVALRKENLMAPAVYDETKSQQEKLLPTRDTHTPNKIINQSTTRSINENTSVIIRLVGAEKQEAGKIGRQSGITEPDDEIQVQEQSRPEIVPEVSETQPEIEPEVSETPPETEPEVSEDAIRKEIEKLIRQLDVSSEIGITEGPKLGDNIQAQVALKNIDKHTTDKVLTFQDQLEDEKYSRARPRSDTSDNEGLSIDPEPFRGDVDSHNENTYDLMEKREIYSLFADIIDTVVNKTM